MNPSTYMKNRWLRIAATAAGWAFLGLVLSTELYFNEKGRAKVELALARGKKLYDKRETDKKRSWDRERGRLLRQKG